MTVAPWPASAHVEAGTTAVAACMHRDAHAEMNSHDCTIKYTAHDAHTA